MKAISDVKMATIVDRLVNLNQPFFTHFSVLPDDEIYWSADDHDLHDSVTKFDEESGEFKRTRELKYFDIWLWSDDECVHHTRVPVAFCNGTDTQSNARYCDVCIGYNTRSGKSLILRVGIDAEGFWFIKKLNKTSQDYAIAIEAW